MSIHEECGVFGVFAPHKTDVASLTYYGLYALQHRGQESCGIVVNDDGLFFSRKDLGLVGEVLTAIAIVALAAAIKRGMPTGARDFLFLKEPFGAPAEDVLDITISDFDQVVPACKQARRFCEEKGADEKTRYRVSLFIEELGCNVVEYGFASDKGKLLEIRIVHFEDGWVLRLRDNCRAFDPVKWVKLHENSDPSVNMGTKLVCRMAKEITYVGTLDLNVLTLRV